MTEQLRNRGTAMKNPSRELRLAVVPTRRKAFSNPAAFEQKQTILAKMRDLELALGFTGLYIEDINEEGLLMEYDEALVVGERFRGKADALFLPHCNFGQEEAVARLARDLDVPVLLWGPRDGAPNGLEWRPTDSQCGMFAASKVLQRYGVPYTYIENCPLESETFARGFAAFLAVAEVVKAFRGLRVAQISTRPKEFLSVMVNEAELLKKHGIEIVPGEATTILAMVDDKLENAREEQEALLKDLTDAGLDISALGDKKYALAAIELALLEFAKSNRCTALSSECWHMFSRFYGVSPCFLLGDLNDRGLPAACENDVHGAITSAMAVAASRYAVPSFVADLTIRHPENDNAELLWHCGPFAKRLKNKDADGYITSTGKGFYELEHGEYTVLRFDEQGGEYYLFADKGRAVNGPVTNGNYLWLEVDDWVKWEKKFIYGPYIHHVVGIPGDFTAILQEACRYLGLHFDSSQRDCHY